MKRFLPVLLCVLLMLSHVACARKPVPVDEEITYTYKNSLYAPTISSPSLDIPPVTTSVIPPEIPIGQATPTKTSNVYTDYSAYTPYTTTNDEIFTRLSADYLPELIPSNNYGTLVPYVGECFWDDFVIYGLCTTNGMIVTDPVYRELYQPSGYNDYQGYIIHPVYKLERLMDKNENGELSISELDDKYKLSEFEKEAYEQFQKIVPNVAVCALDGSWVTDYYFKVAFFDEFMLLYRGKDADVFDYNGNFLYNTQDLNVQLQLNDDPLFEWVNHIWDYGDGYFFIWAGWRYDGNIRKGEYAFVNERTGETHILPYEDAYSFSDGLAAVEQGGLWGYINTDMELVIDFQFEYANRFIEGLAKCRLPDGKYVLITKDGEITVESYSNIDNPSEKQHYDTAEPEFIYDSYNGTIVRDRNGRILFTYDGKLSYWKHAKVFTLMRYNGDWYYDLRKFELLDTTGKCVFRKNVISQWSDD